MASPLPASIPVVLVVEDEPLLLRLVARMLESAGYLVLTASGAHQALAQLRQRGCPADLLLTDVFMDPMDGPSLARMVQQSYPEVRVLFMSGCAADHGTLPGPLLKKPFKADQLLLAVHGLLGSEARSSQATE